MRISRAAYWRRFRLFTIKNATSSAYNMILFQYQGTYVILFIQFIYKM